MRSLRIVFMGTPDFAVATLQALTEQKMTVVGVVTAPDKPAGRGRKLQQSAVKQYALQHQLPILQPNNLKDPSFLAALAALAANLQIVVAFRMLPESVWGMPEYGTFNLHASLLPDYRGAAPINWVLLNGETQTGVTTFFIDDKIDTGEIILQEGMAITAADTAGSLHDKLMYLGAQLVLKTVSLIAKGPVETQKQPTGKPGKLAYKIHKETCKIDWQQSLEQIYNHIRGLSPYPTAWTTLNHEGNEVFLKIYAASADLELHTHAIGSVHTTKKEIRIAVDKGFITLLEIQLPGKRRMQAKEVLNGLKLQKSARVY